MAGDARFLSRFLAWRQRDDLIEADDDDNRTILATRLVYLEARTTVRRQTACTSEKLSDGGL